MRLVKIEHDGRCGEGVLVGEDVHLVGDWSPGAADKTPFNLGTKTVSELQALLDASKTDSGHPGRRWAADNQAQGVRNPRLRR